MRPTDHAGSMCWSSYLTSSHVRRQSAAIASAKLEKGPVGAHTPGPVWEWRRLLVLLRTRWRPVPTKTIMSSGLKTFVSTPSMSGPKGGGAKWKK